MTIFLLVYDRGARRLVRVQPFEQDRRAQALEARYDAELSAARKGQRQEIVLFEAESLDTLKQTHGSYFYSVKELADRMLKAAS